MAQGLLILLAAAMVQMLLEHEDCSRRDLSSLRLVCVGGSAIAPELARHAQAALGVPLTVMYGLTEACGIVAQTRIDDPEKDRVQTIGRPHPHVEVKIIDPWRGVEIPAGAVGELLVRGYFVMNGYLDLPEATREAIDPGGWLHTGDLATLDDRGYLRITGRLKEIINRGARKIAPGEITVAAGPGRTARPTRPRPRRRQETGRGRRNRGRRASLGMPLT